MEGTDGVETINCPSKLSEEATYINRFFSQQILKTDETYEFKESHPDHDPESDAHYAYRYRQWDLKDDIKLFARTKIDAVIHQSTTTTSSAKDIKFVSIKALNEFDSRAVGAGGAPEWRQKIDSQRGAVMASELKNNGNKLAKWTVEALLAGTDQIRLGFCSRVNPRDRTRHAILGTTFFKYVACEYLTIKAERV
jgi:translation initiation factor 3 subunit D